MSTGPTGPIDHDLFLSILNGSSGFTGAHNYLLEVGLAWTGPTGPPPPVVEDTVPIPILSHDELEAIDISALSVLISSTFDISSWHVAGCPDMFVLVDIPLVSVGTCSDGIVRNHGRHVEYLLKKNLGDIVRDVAATMPGTSVSWSTYCDGFRLHLTKAS